MRALVLEGINDLQMREVPKPVPAEDEVLIRTKAGTICTSDINDIKANPFHIPLPVVIGHEGAGIVEAVGALVTEFQPGDEVVSHSAAPCGNCPTCKRGYGNLCGNLKHLGIHKSGVFGEYFTMRQDRVRRKPAKISFAEGALLEPVSVCIEAIKRGNVREGDTVLVIGDGPFGIIVCRLCAAMKNTRVILVGHHESRMAAAKDAIAINRKKEPDVLSAVADLTEGQGVDSAILCVGANDALDLAIAALRPRGTVSVFSALHGKATVDMTRVHMKELNLCGSCNDVGYLDEAVATLGSGLMEGVVSHTFPFEQYQQAFDMATSGKEEAFKVAIVFDGAALPNPGI